MAQRVYFEPWGPSDDIEIVINHRDDEMSISHPATVEHLATIVKVTSEGVIIDFYSDSEVLGTIGMTYDEWFLMATTNRSKAEI